jgi:hypothetical protein
MTLRVDMSNPPPWVVHVGWNETEMTWPFDEYGDAENAVSLAKMSGQFRMTMRTATKRQPAVVVEFVSLWRRAERSANDGTTMTIYEKVNDEHIGSLDKASGR